MFVSWPQHCTPAESDPFKNYFQSSTDELMNDQVAVMNFSGLVDLSSFSLSMRELEKCAF